MMKNKMKKLEKLTKKEVIALGAGTVGVGLIWTLLKRHSKKKRMEVFADFDGTICSNKFPDTGEPEPGVREELGRLIKEVDVVVHSCRTAKYWSRYVKNHKWKEQEKTIKEFMKKHKIPYTRIEIEYDKPFYFDNIDDSVTEYKGDWNKAVNSVLKKLEEYKKNERKK